MHTASSRGHLDVVQMLLEAGAKIDEPRTQDGTTPLFDAVQGGHLHIVRLLVEAGARKDAVADDGSTPLCLAAELNRLDIVQFLLERGADKDHATHDGLTPCILQPRTAISEWSNVWSNLVQNPHSSVRNKEWCAPDSWTQIIRDCVH